MIERVQLYLDEMEQAAREACEFTKGMTYDAFLSQIASCRRPSA